MPDHRAIANDPDASRRLVDSVVDHALVLLSPDGNVASWNRGAERITGYAAGEIVGRSVAVLFPADEAGRLETALAAARERGSAEDEGWQLRKDRGRFWARSNFS